MKLINIKGKIKEQFTQKELEQNNRKIRLTQLEEKQQEKKFLKNPIKTIKEKKEIKTLKKEIKNYEDRKRSGKLIIGLIVMLVFSISAMCMVPSDDNSAANYSNRDQIYDKAPTDSDDKIEVDDESTVDAMFIEDTDDKEENIHVHSYTVISKVEAKEGIEGSINYSCDCGENYSEIIPALPVQHMHSYSMTSRVEPQIGTSGYMLYSCSCGSNYKETIPALPQPNQSGNMVWIPQNGSKYHSSSLCSNMKNPSQVTLSQATSWGYTACKKCH